MATVNNIIPDAIAVLILGILVCLIGLFIAVKGEDL